MKNYHKISTKNFTTPEECMETLLELIGKECTEDEICDIRKAYKIACSAHEGQKRLSGEPYIMHPLSVALILASLGMDEASIVAAILHDTVEDTSMTHEEVEKEFGTTIAELVEGVTKIGKVPLQTKEEQQAENIRKMLIAMSRDIRVIIIKLADRLHNMRTLMFKPEQRRREIALETIEIYAPIAHRLGIRPIKEELEDLSISYLDPVAYSEIEESLENQSRTRNEFLSDIQERIRERIETVVSGAQVNGRIKSVHGIYRKMYMQNKNFDQIYDIYAVRIIVDTVIDCYNCLGVIHDMFKPIPGRFKDYISTPERLSQLENIIEMCKSKGVNLVVVFLPKYLKLHNDISSINDIVDICKKYDLKYYIDVQKEEYLNDSTMFYDETHLNKEGAYKYTRDLVCRMKKDSIF